MNTWSWPAFNSCCLYELVTITPSQSLGESTYAWAHHHQKNKIYNPEVPLTLTNTRCNTQTMKHLFSGLKVAVLFQNPTVFLLIYRCHFNFTSTQKAREHLSILKHEIIVIHSDYKRFSALFILGAWECVIAFTENWSKTFVSFFNPNSGSSVTRGKDIKHFLLLSHYAKIN